MSSGNDENLLPTLPTLDMERWTNDIGNALLEWARVRGTQAHDSAVQVPVQQISNLHLPHLSIRLCWILLLMDVLWAIASLAKVLCVALGTHIKLGRLALLTMH